jgi:hypothetical protein
VAGTERIVSQRDEATETVLNAARALKQRCPLDGVYPQAPVRPYLARLYAAVDACESVDGEQVPPIRSPGLCADPDCWDYRWMGGRHCFGHRELDAGSRERAQLRAGVFRVGDET